MATVEECQTALHELAARLSAVDPELRARYAAERTIVCHVSDLGADFTGRVHDGELLDITAQRDPTAQIGISLTSDDLIALTEGRLDVTIAWASGRVLIDASVFDLLMLRSLL